MNEFNLKFDLPKLIIYESKYWIWSLRPEQPTLGSSVISLKRKCSYMRELTLDEHKDYGKIVKVVEASLKKLFNYSKINYLMLMMVDNQVHYHVIPRYDKEISFDNMLWYDYGWPNLPELNKINNSKKSEEILLHTLKETTKKYISENYKIGYTTGVFDLFHVGHLNILKKAKEQCDYLIVGVSTDELVSYKNKKAVIPLEDRMEIVKNIKWVDEVVVQENMNKMEAWDKYRFNLMFVGSDWQGTEKWNNFERQFAEIGVEIRYIPYTQKVSSTMLREKIGAKNE